MLPQEQIPTAAFKLYMGVILQDYMWSADRSGFQGSQNLYQIVPYAFGGSNIENFF